MSESLTTSYQANRDSSEAKLEDWAREFANLVYDVYEKLEENGIMYLGQDESNDF